MKPEQAWDVNVHRAGDVKNAQNLFGKYEGKIKLGDQYLDWTVMLKGI